MILLYIEPSDMADDGLFAKPFFCTELGAKLRIEGEFVKGDRVSQDMSLFFPVFAPEKVNAGVAAAAPKIGRTVGQKLLAE